MSSSIPDTKKELEGKIKDEREQEWQDLTHLESQKPKTHDEIVQLIKDHPLDENLPKSKIDYISFQFLEILKEQFFQLGFLDISEIFSDLQSDSKRENAFQELKQLAITKKHVHYLFCLAFCYDRAIGCKEDIVLAYETYKMLCDKKYPLALVMMLSCYSSERYGFSDYSKIRGYFKKSVENKTFFYPALEYGINLLENNPDNNSDKNSEALKYLNFALDKDKRQRIAPLLIVSRVLNKIPQEMKDKCLKICLDLINESLYIKNILADWVFADLNTQDKLRKCDEYLLMPHISSVVLEKMALIYEKAGKLEKSMKCWMLWFENFSPQDFVHFDFNIFCEFLQRNPKLRPEFEDCYRHFEVLVKTNHRQKLRYILTNLVGLGIGKKLDDIAAFKQEVNETFGKIPDKAQLITSPIKTLDEIMVLVRELPTAQVPDLILSHPLYMEMHWLLEEFGNSMAFFFAEAKGKNNQFFAVRMLKLRLEKSPQDFHCLYLLAKCLFWGFGCLKNKLLAYEIHRMLDKNGYALSTLELGKYHETGEFGMRDIEKAFQLKMKAAHQTHFSLPKFMIGLDLHVHCKDKRAFKYLIPAAETHALARSILLENYEHSAKSVPSGQLSLYLIAARVALSRGDDFMIFSAMTAAIRANDETLIAEHLDLFLRNSNMYDCDNGPGAKALKKLVEILEAGTAIIQRDLSKALMAWERILEHTTNSIDIEQFSNFIEKNKSALKSEIKLLLYRLNNLVFQRSPRTLFLMGEFKRLGVGCPRNVLHAIPCYLEAARLGSGEAKVALTRLFTTHQKLLDFNFAMQLAQNLKASNHFQYGSIEKEISTRKMLYDVLTIVLDLPYLPLGQLTFDYLWDEKAEVSEAQDAHSKELCLMYQTQFQFEAADTNETVPEQKRGSTQKVA